MDVAERLAQDRALAREIGPLALTSANRTGERDATTAREVADAVGPAAAVILDDGPVTGGVPSTLVAVTGDGAVSVLRVGAVAEEDVMDAVRRR